MKKLILSLALLAAIAAPTFAQFHVGIGYSSDNKSGSILGYGDRFWFNGIYAGAGYTFNILGPLSFTPGVYFDFLKYTDKLLSTDYGSYNLNFNEIYLKVPATFSLGFDISSSVRGFVFAGPKLMVGLSSMVNDGRDRENLYQIKDYSRVNVLLGGGVGIDICDKLRISVGYDGGLINRYKGKAQEKIKISDSGLHAGIAYLF